MGAPSSAAVVEGNVVNKVTGAPVRHAHVMYLRLPGSNPAPISTDTDSDGRFSISLEAGSYRLWVERPGFERQAYGSSTAQGAGSVLTLAAGQEMRDINFRIVPLGAIAGRVLDEEGEPLQGAAIQVLRFSFTSGTRKLIPVSGASSNDRGEYRAYGLSAGRYYLLATLRGVPPSHPPETDGLLSDVQEPLAALYYPGVLDFGSASQISLPEGGELEADFHLQRIHAVTVRGRLFGAVEDFSNSRIQVVLAHNDGNTASFINRATATVDNASGRFEFHGITPGSYLLIASQLYGERSLSGRVPVEINADNPQQAVNVSLSPAFDLAGTIEIEGGNAKFPAIVIRLAASEGLVLGQQPWAKVGPDGSFRLAAVTPAIWDFTLDGLPGDLWIKSASLGNLDVLHGELNLSSGAKGPLRIVLARNGAQVSGTVTQNGQPCNGVVVLAPAAADLQGSAQMYRSMATQDQGTFVFKGVRPGAYKLFAFQDVEPMAWLDPEFLKPVESLGEAISVGEGERATRQLTPIPPDALLPGR